MPVMKEVLEKYRSDCFIETGTSSGDTTIEAVKAGFGKVLSIEIRKEAYLKAKGRLENEKNVFLYYGDSSIFLPDIIKDVNVDNGKGLVFYLDAHKASPTDEGTYPLLDELNIMLSCGVKNSTILIDDYRLFDTELGVGKDTVYEVLKKINPSYDFKLESSLDFKDDVLVAYENH
jgi:hypothetical protein